MEFFDKLGQKASEAYKITADKTGKIAKEAKLRIKISDLKSQVNNCYQNIGKKVYEKHIRENEMDIEKELEEECTKIDVLSDEIEANLIECLELKGKKQCQQCFKEIEKEVKFCPECGAKQEEQPVKEVEILEKLEKVDIKPEKEAQKETVKENLEQKVQESEEQNEIEEIEKDKNKTTLEKTVEIEIDPKTEGDNQRISFEEE